MKNLRHSLSKNILAIKNNNGMSTRFESNTVFETNSVLIALNVISTTALYYRQPLRLNERFISNAVKHSWGS